MIWTVLSKLEWIYSKKSSTWIWIVRQFYIKLKCYLICELMHPTIETIEPPHFHSNVAFLIVSMEKLSLEIIKQFSRVCNVLWLMASWSLLNQSQFVAFHFSLFSSRTSKKFVQIHSRYRNVLSVSHIIISRLRVKFFVARNERWCNLQCVSSVICLSWINLLQE